MTKHRKNSAEKIKRNKADEVNCGMMTMYSAVTIIMVLVFIYIVFFSGSDIELDDEF